MVTITLTKEQAGKLSEVLWATQDEGPPGEEWASDDLLALRSIVDEAIEFELGTFSNIRYGCHCEIENTVSGQPDDCVLNNGDIEDCIYAKHGMRPEQCKYWRPISIYMENGVESVTETIESRLAIIEKKIDELLALQPKKRERKKAAEDADLPGFDEFWSHYPRRECVAQAKKAYRKVNGIQHLAAILADINRRLADGRWKDKQYIPYGSTYLNQRRWEENEDIEQNDVPWNMI